jgi:peptidoglycan/xylan/chitin deacetylase (PgdA/CDA1 family)
MQIEMKGNQFLFHGGKRKAATFSFDDGHTQDIRLVELMRKYGIKATFNLNSGSKEYTSTVNMGGKIIEMSSPPQEKIPEIYEGFEIATHGRNHNFLTDLGPLALTEIIEDRKFFESLLSCAVCGHAYPFGAFDEKVKDMLRCAGIKYARTCDATMSFDLPKDYLEWNPTCHYNVPELMPLAEKFCDTEGFIRFPQLFYVWGHSYELDQYENWDKLEALFKYLSDNSDLIWFASNGEIYDYVKAYNSLEFTADGERAYNPTLNTVWVSSRKWGEESKTHMISPGETVSLWE